MEPDENKGGSVNKYPPSKILKYGIAFLINFAVMFFVFSLIINRPILTLSFMSAFYFTFIHEYK